MHIPDNVVIGDSLSVLKEFRSANTFDRTAVLVDENTRAHCLPKSEIGDDVAIIEIRSGEENKTLETCTHIWQQMTDLKMSRKSLLINLGGGVIGDMGGFVASTYKRGMSFVNVPTTLLAQVDASIGGKLAIDFNGLKNHIGIFREPNLVICDTQYLSTLPDREIRSGFAEIVKHCLIRDKEGWYQLKQEAFDPQKDWSTILERSVGLKGSVVKEDPEEQGLRKILNFGHTLGHAIETYFLDTNDRLLHGEAIAIGMILEGYLSTHVSGLPESDLQTLTKYLLDTYGKVEIPDLKAFGQLLIHDKKNAGGKVNYSLLSEIGSCFWDQQVETSLIHEAIAFYRNC
ncbi:MAG: 3-dehydroquinate synthase [Cytophagales bacterium]|nr:3-dehydroquinate synthase [Cytophagales bacterium]